MKLPDKYQNIADVLKKSRPAFQTKEYYDWENIVASLADMFESTDTGFCWDLFTRECDH